MAKKHIKRGNPTLSGVGPQSVDARNAVKRNRAKKSSNQEQLPPRDLSLTVRHTVEAKWEQLATRPYTIQVNDGVRGRRAELSDNMAVVTEIGLRTTARNRVSEVRLVIPAQASPLTVSSPKRLRI